MKLIFTLVLLVIGMTVLKPISNPWVKFSPDGKEIVEYTILTSTGWEKQPIPHTIEAPFNRY